MATFNKFNCFVEDLAEKVHNLGSDQLTIALTNTAPSAANAVLTDITEISYTNLSARDITTVSSSQTSGTYKLVLQDLVLTATGAVATFRYVVLYNNTAASDNLIGWYDYGQSVSLLNGETFTIDFDGSTGALTIA
jgi:hypothetical protein